MDFDVFLSHNSKDKPAVEEIARLLTAEHGLKCWLDKWNLIPGDPWQEALEQALDQCQTVAVFVGPNTISPWENEEMRSALETRVHEKDRRVIPVLLPGAPDNRDLKLPRFLTRLTWVDFRSGLDDKDALHRLYCGIEGIAPGADSTTPIAKPAGGLPPGSYLPFTRNALFTGREKDLEQLAASLTGRGDQLVAPTVVTQAITGMGGLGKTQLAVEFAYRYGQHFKGVHWLDLRDPSALESQIALCGSKMALQPWPEKQPEQVAITQQTWQTNGPRLLILDNFEEVTKANEVLAYFQHPSLRLLVTSRRSDFPPSIGLQVQKLDTFTPQESLDFLAKTLPSPTDGRAELTEKLGHLPLALELAANYITINKITITDYLQELENLLAHESMGAEWFQELEIVSPTAHDQSLLVTFQLTWALVKDETAQNVFKVAGYCAPNAPIPLEIFKETLKLDDKAFNQAMYRLNALGLLNAENDQPTIHPLLASFARSLNGTSKEILEKLADKLSLLSKQANDQVDQTGSLAWFVPLRPHILSTGEYAEKEEIQDAANLLGNLGSYLRIVADYPGAKSAQERALHIDEKASPSDHPNVAIRINDLGGVLEALGDLAGAKAAFERALRIDEKAFGSDHPTVAIRVNNLGLVLKDLGDLTGAKAAFERALRIDEKAFSPDHPTISTDLNSLGFVLKDLGDLTGAKAACERALRIDEKAFSPDHPTVAVHVNNLGLVLKDLGDLTGAKAAFERALYIEEKAFGPDHPDVAKTINNLGTVLQVMGDLPGAKAAYERAIKIDEMVFGPDHPDVAKTINNLGSVLRDLGDLTGAKAAFERALPIFEKTYGNTFETAELLNNLGIILVETGNSSGGLNYLRRAIFIMQKALPHSHPLRKKIDQNMQFANIMIRNPAMYKNRRRH